jgi:hypothetical protein
MTGNLELWTPPLASFATDQHGVLYVSVPQGAWTPVKLARRSSTGGWVESSLPYAALYAGLGVDSSGGLALAFVARSPGVQSTAGDSSIRGVAPTAVFVAHSADGGGTWSASSLLYDTGHHAANWLQVVTSADGVHTAVWASVVTERWDADSLLAARSTDGGRTWSMLDALHVPDLFNGLALGVDREGAVHVAMLSKDGTRILGNKLVGNSWRAPFAFPSKPSWPSMFTVSPDSLYLAGSVWRYGGPYRAPIVWLSRYARCDP